MSRFSHCLVRYLILITFITPCIPQPQQTYQARRHTLATTHSTPPHTTLTHRITPHTHASHTKEHCVVGSRSLHPPLFSSPLFVMAYNIMIHFATLLLIYNTTFVITTHPQLHFNSTSTPLKTRPHHIHFATPLPNTTTHTHDTPGLALALLTARNIPGCPPLSPPISQVAEVKVEAPLDPLQTTNF